MDIGPVLAILRKQGYANNHHRAYALHLTKQDTSKKRRDGKYERRMLIGITRGDLDNILTTAESPMEAAIQIEAIALGQQVGTQAPARTAATPTLDTDTMASLIENRAEHKAREIRAEVQDNLARMQALADKFEKMIAVLETTVADPTPPPAATTAAPAKRKPGRPPKNKPAETAAEKPAENLDWGPRKGSQPESFEIT